MSGSQQRRYPQIAKAIYERPWAIQPAMLAVIEEIVRLRLAGTPLSPDEIEARVTSAQTGPRRGAARAQGVAVIPIYGVIAPKANLFSEMSGATTVEGLLREFRGAIADPDIGAIVFDVDSPGGSVEAITEAAAEIRAARGQKPMATVSNTLMASAASWLGMQADEVIASPSSVNGAIGIIGMHVDVSAADEMMGEKYTIITAGEGKADGNEHLPLSDDARADMQSMADDFYALFVADVAAARGVTAKTVTDDWQAQVFTAKKARAAGMVDRVDTLDATLRRYVAKANRRSSASALSPAIAFDASAIGRHKTATSDEAWDAGENEKRLPAERDPLRSAHAWVDDDADPDAKGSYKFIHHEVATEGQVGAANTRACSNGIAVLNGGRGGADIPESDREGVHAHLAGHLRDAGKDAPPLRGEHTPAVIAAHLATLPIHEQLALLNAEGERVAAHYAKRAELRAKEGRAVPPVTEEQLAALDSLRSIQSDPIVPDLDTDQPEEADQPKAATRPHARFEILEAAARGGYTLPKREVPTA